MSTIPLKPEAVGLAFLQQIGTVNLLTSKRKRKSLFLKLIRSLNNLDLIPAKFDVNYLTFGVDSNGNEIILVEGQHETR